MMSTWSMALILIVLVLIPRMLLGRTPKEQECEESARERRERRADLHQVRPLRSPSQGWAIRR